MIFIEILSKIESLNLERDEIILIILDYLGSMLDL